MEPVPPVSSGLKYAQAAAHAASSSQDKKSDEKGNRPLVAYPPNIINHDAAHEKPVENAWAEPPKIIDQVKHSSSDVPKLQSRLQSPVQPQAVPGAQSLLASQYPGKTVSGFII